MEQMLKVKDFAKMAKISLSKAYRLLRRKEIPHCRFPQNIIRLHPKDVINFIKKRKEQK